MSTLRKAAVRIAACTIAAAAVALTGCNTVKGVGQDIQSAGEAGEKAISGN
jgi:predicted small secreted protein